MSAMSSTPSTAIGVDDRRRGAGGPKAPDGQFKGHLAAVAQADAVLVDTARSAGARSRRLPCWLRAGSIQVAGQCCVDAQTSAKSGTSTGPSPVAWPIEMQFARRTRNAPDAVDPRKNRGQWLWRLRGGDRGRVSVTVSESGGSATSGWSTQARLRGAGLRGDAERRRASSAHRTSSRSRSAAASCNRGQAAQETGRRAFGCSLIPVGPTVRLARQGRTRATAGAVRTHPGGVINGRLPVASGFFE